MRKTLNYYKGKYLPNAISTRLFLHSEKVKSILGDKVIRIRKASGNTWFYTEKGYQVSSNGYVVKKIRR